MNCEITYMPAEFTVSALRGDTVLDAALEHGIEIPHECGGNCACTTCLVTVRAGMEWLSPIEETEADRISTDGAAGPASRLSCQALIYGGPVMVYVQGTRSGQCS